MNKACASSWNPSPPLEKSKIRLCIYLTQLCPRPLFSKYSSRAYLSISPPLRLLIISDLRIAFALPLPHSLTSSLLSLHPNANINISHICIFRTLSYHAIFRLDGRCCATKRPITNSPGFGRSAISTHRPFEISSFNTTLPVDTLTCVRTDTYRNYLNTFYLELLLLLPCFRGYSDTTTLVGRLQRYHDRVSGAYQRVSVFGWYQQGQHCSIKDYRSFCIGIRTGNAVNIVEEVVWVCKGSVLGFF